MRPSNHDRAMAVKGRIAPAPRSRRRERELRPDELRRRVDPARLGFASTAEVPPLVGTIGQPRALDALEYGLAVGTRGFNLFVSGLPGSGRLTIGEGIEILTGRKVGRRRADGSYPPGSVHALVSARLAEYADRLREFAE